MNKELLQKSIELFLESIDNNNINDEVIKNTPNRVVNSWIELLNGYNINETKLYKTFKSTNKNLVLIKNIEFTSICEHHLLPFSGSINIGYIPENKVLGLSKFSRIVDCFARRLQLQEKLVNEIGNSLINNLEIKDLFIMAQAVHSCVSCRGVNQKNSSTITFFMSGKFKNYKENELIDIIKNY